MTFEQIRDRALRDSVEFPYLLANHAPMVILALHRLGASAQRIAQWYEGYRTAHAVPPVPPPVAPIRAENWRDALGERAREADYRAFFTRETRRLGLTGVVLEYLPHLVQGVAGSALHPLMRLAYATLANDEAEAGAALGYWAACHLPLPPPGARAPDTDDPAEVLAGIGGIEGVRDYKIETDLLWHNIRAVAALPGFAPVVDRLAFGPETPRRLAATALALFAATQDFSALHAVTGLHWVRVVATQLDDAEPLYRAFWQVIAALVPKIGFPQMPDAQTLESLRETRAPTWPEIKSRAVVRDDEHDISLVFSAWQEHEVWGDPLYRVVAARRVSLIGGF